MRKADVLLRGGLDAAQSNRYLTLLSAMGIEALVVPEEASGALRLLVAATDAESAARLLEEADAEQSRRRREEHEAAFHRPGELAPPRGWFGRGSDAVWALAVLCSAVFVRASDALDAGTRSRLLSLGAISDREVRSGEIWRFATAVFLHFDITHLLSNMAALVVIGPPLAHQVGALRFLAVFLVGGVGANVVSFLVAPTGALKAGASGAIAALLGALGGQRLRTPSARLKPWQILAALAAFYGLTIGFGPGRDNVAHVAGLVIGIALGRIMKPQPLAQGFAREPRDPSHSS